ncbi:MAG: helix-turn-helix transcriptional regulator [Bacteroidota bacterium]
MTLQERLRKIREYRGFKQAAAAQEMKITQQAYSCLETKSGNLKMETMQRFCEVMKIEMAFLLAFDLNINDENMKMFDSLNLSGVVNEYKKLTNRISVYEELLRNETGMKRREDGVPNRDEVSFNPNNQI